MKGRRRDRFGVLAWLVAALASVAVIVASPAQPAESSGALEERVTLAFPLVSAGIQATADVGGVTFELRGRSAYTMVWGERPGEGSWAYPVVFPTERVRGSTGLILWVPIGAQNSEVRVRNRWDTRNLSLSAVSGQRLCFRKVEESSWESGWVYVCGRGQVTYADGRVVELGDKRTVDSCLSLLTSSDPIFREGGARDLGRLTTAEEAQRVMPRLVPLLQDSVPYVRRGAAEGLGLIGRQECVGALRAAGSTEQEELTKKYIAEGLALCAGNTLIGEPNAPELSASEAAKLYLEGRTGWADDILAQRIQARGGAGAQTLIARLSSSAAAERQGAARLLGAARCAEAREALTKVSTDDPDDEVKAAAKAALDQLPKP